MKIAIIYNRESKNVINLFGIPNREKYGKNTIKLISDALRKGGHQVQTFEGDKGLIDHLEEFMPRVVHGERPGMVFNLSYGIQGQARYTHVPSILEMVGIPYVGSNPLAHSLSLDKEVTKVILKQNGLPTPDFVVLKDPDFEMPAISFPLIVKPKSEAVSFGIKIVNDEQELRDAVRAILDQFGQPVLVESFIEGREINVGLLGNNPIEALPPVEIIFGSEGPPIFTYEDKTHKSAREINHECPANIDQTLTEKAQDMAKKAFVALGCYDCARVDMRMDKKGNLWILEINSLPSLGVGGSYVLAAKRAGLDYEALVNRLVEIASSRYFGTPSPSEIGVKKKDAPSDAALSFLIQRRDHLERRLQKWCGISSRTADPVGKRIAAKELAQTMEELKMVFVPELTDERSHWMWSTKKGFDDGTLIIAHLDVPQSLDVPTQVFRRDPEFLYGEGIGSSRAPIVMLEYALRALRSQRLLKKLPLGVLFYGDEGVDASFSTRAIRDISARANHVLILWPGNPGNKVILQRRGLINYRLVAEGKPIKLGQATRGNEVLLWTAEKLGEISALSSREDKVAVSAMDIKSDGFPMLLPHRVTTQLMLNYYDAETLNHTKNGLADILESRTIRASLEVMSDRPPMKDKPENRRLFRILKETAAKWDIPLESTSSLWPSVGGLISDDVPVVCGMGPVAEDIYTPQERIHRISLVQRTLLLTQYLIHLLEK